MTGQEKAIACAMNLLGPLLDGDTLTDLMNILAEVEEGEALLQVGALQGRIERRLLAEGTDPTEALREAAEIAERVRKAWVGMHQG